MGKKLAILLAICACVAAYILSYGEQRLKLWKLMNTCPLHWFNSPFSGDIHRGDKPSMIRLDTDLIMTKEELSQYTGAEGSLGLYLGCLGRVYDVSEKPQHYGPNGGYGFFAGKDGTKAFMTGEFNEKGLVDEIDGLSDGQMIEMENWIKFYESTYIYKGKVIGNFYDEKGQPKELLYEAQRLVDKAHQVKNKEEEERKKFPPCNSQWKKADGFAKVYCSDKSGGYQRAWVGVPRKLYSQKTGNTRCVCVKDTGPPQDDPGADTDVGDLNNPHLEEYADCPPTSVSCTFVPDNK